MMINLRSFLDLLDMSFLYLSMLHTVWHRPLAVYYSFNPRH